MFAETTPSKPPKPSFAGFEGKLPTPIQKIDSFDDTSAALPPEASIWLAGLAALLRCSPEWLWSQGFIDWHDLLEQHHTHPRFAAALVRSHPKWGSPMPADHPVIEPQDIPSEQTQRSTATAPPEWIAAGDAFHAHALGQCSKCYPPAGRYCLIGASLRSILRLSGG